MRKHTLFLLIPLLLAKQASAQLSDGADKYSKRTAAANEDITTGLILSNDTLSLAVRLQDTQFAVEPGTGEEWMIVKPLPEPVKLNNKDIYTLQEVQAPALLTSNKKFKRYLDRYLRKERKWIDKADGTGKSIVFIVNESGQVAYLRIDGRFNWYKTVSVADFNRFEDSLRQKLTALALKPAQKDGQPVPCMIVIPG